MSSSTGTWPFPERFRLSWKAGAVLLRLPSVFFGTRLLKWTQKVQVKNGETLVKAVMDRPKGTALVTVANHLSYIDDASFYHLLPLRSVFSERKVKWTPSADEICFTNRVTSAYFSRCHAVPVIRGQGVYQRGVDFLINRLNEGHWIHIYPEGKMNNSGKNMRLKWGVGRVIAEARMLPIVLPMWLVGLDDILPIEPPILPNFFKKFTVYVGEPMDMSSVVQHSDSGVKLMSSSAVVVRKQITDAIQEKMRELRTKAEELHSSWNCTAKVAYRQL